MKYSININQLALQQIDKRLDLLDGAIIVYLKDFCGPDNEKLHYLYVEENGHRYRYTWVDYKHLLKEMPLLRMKTTSSIVQRMKKIEKAGLIKKKVFRSEKTGQKKAYIRLCEKIQLLDFDRPLQSKKSKPTILEKEAYNPRKVNNYTKDNNTKEQSIGLSPDCVGSSPRSNSSSSQGTSLQGTFSSKKLSDSSSPVHQIMGYFAETVFKEYGFEPQIPFAAAGKHIKTLLKRFEKSEEDPVQKIKDIIDWYLDSEKCDRHGVNLTVALSCDTVNNYLKENDSVV